MRKRKKLLFILAGIMVLVGASAAYAVTTFTDIGGTTHEKSIIWAVDNGITIGYADGTFRPNNPTTRGQMTTFLNRFYNNLVKPLENGSTSGDVSGCVQCHDDTTLITGKKAQWEHSVFPGPSTADENLAGLGHAGEVYWLEGDNRSCAGCHSGGTFSNRIAAGAAPNAVTDAMMTDKTPIDCRACHQIHETGKPADWALETVAKVTLFATPTREFNDGKGNLCANCHQARRTIPAPVSVGTSTETTVSAHYGPHASPQASALVGTAGAAANGTVLQGSGMMHYTGTTGVTDTCVSCHMANADHTFRPNTAACAPCHGTVSTTDIGGFQSEVVERLDAIGAALAALPTPLLEPIANDPGTPWVDYQQAGGENTTASRVPTDQAVALWNYIYLVYDGSSGAHNPGYVSALLDAAEAFMD